MKLLHFNLLICTLACAWTGCALWNGGGNQSNVSGKLELTASLNAETYQPGQAVICELTLTNGGKHECTVPVPDHTNVQFSFMPRQPDGLAKMKLPEPVYSEKQPTGDTAVLAAGEAVTRRFVFTQLTIDRGEFGLRPVFAIESPDPGGVPEKVYAPPVGFKVEGEKVVLNRYPDGLVTKDEAIRLATEKAGAGVSRSEARMILDSKGFKQWQVNLWMEGSDPAKPAKAYYVSPYLGKVWVETTPFDQQVEQERTLREDSKILEKFREKRR